MTPRRMLATVGAALLGVVALAGCQPQPLEIDFTVRRTATFSEARGVTSITLTGVRACTGGTTSDREPLDLFLTASQGNVKIYGAEAYDRCSADPQVWMVTWQVQLTPGQHLTPGQLQVSVLACTNPADHIDEACETATDTVRLTRSS